MTLLASPTTIDALAPGQGILFFAGDGFEGPAGFADVVITGVLASVGEIAERIIPEPPGVPARVVRYVEVSFDDGRNGAKIFAGRPLFVLATGATAKVYLRFAPPDYNPGTPSIEVLEVGQEVIQPQSPTYGPPPTIHGVISELLPIIYPTGYDTEQEGGTPSDALFRAVRMPQYPHPVRIRTVVSFAIVSPP